MLEYADNIDEVKVKSTKKAKNSVTQKVFEEEKLYKGEGKLKQSNFGSGYLALSEFPQSVNLPAIEEESNFNKKSPDKQSVNELLEFVGRVKGQKNARNLKANTFTPN